MATVSGYQYVPGGTDSFTPNAAAAALHDALVAAGWSVEYLDADAIGSGSEEAPAWDKNFSSSSSVGVAVYRMPVNGSLTRWYVKPEFGWGTQSTRAMVRGLTIGTAHTGGGTLTGGNSSTPLAPGASTATTTENSWVMNVSEDGFFLAVSGTYRKLWCERARVGEEVQDQVIASATHNLTEPYLQLIDASAGVVSTDVSAVAYLYTTGATWNAINTNARLTVNGVGDITNGPFFLYGIPMIGPPRLWRTIPSNSVSDKVPVDITVDGGVKAYVPHTDLLNTFGTLLVASE